MIKKIKSLFLATAAVFCFASNLFSQTENGKFIISVAGNYMQSTTENGVSNNQNVTKGKYLNAETSVGYFITHRIIAGLGLDYNWGKEDRTNSLMINRYYQAEITKIKSNVFLPNIYLGYYYPITDKLYVNTNLKFSYGVINSEYKTAWGGMVYYSPYTIPEVTDEYSSSYSRESSRVSRSDFFSVEIIPELSYFLSPGFSAYIGLGGAGYSLLDWKKDNSSWAINFNPSYWTAGIKLSI